MSGQWSIERASRTRVLVVEKQPDSNFSLPRLLHHLGCDYDVCRVASHAIVRTAEFVPELVLLDMELLGDEGYAIAGALRNLIDAHPMIVSITSDGMFHRQECENAGIDLHVFRPIELETLRLLLEESGWIQPVVTGHYNNSRVQGRSTGSSSRSA